MCTGDPTDPPVPPSALRGRVVLITGAASGIGRACAEAFSAAGAAVHLVDQDAEVEAVANRVGGRAHLVDFTRSSAIAELPRHVDVLVNNAGFQHVAPIAEFPAERFARMQQVMVTAPFLLVQRCLPHMYASGWGRLLHISSVHGLRASAYKSGYVAAKHALEGLSKTAAVEGAPHGVTSNCINPGYVRTPSSRTRSRPRHGCTTSPRTRWSNASSSNGPRSSGWSSPRKWPTPPCGSAVSDAGRSPVPRCPSTAGGQRGRPFPPKATAPTTKR